MIFDAMNGRFTMNRADSGDLTSHNRSSRRNSFDIWMRIHDTDNFLLNGKILKYLGRHDAYMTIFQLVDLNSSGEAWKYVSNPYVCPFTTSMIGVRFAQTISCQLNHVNPVHHSYHFNTWNAEDSFGLVHEVRSESRCFVLQTWLEPRAPTRGSCTHLIQCRFAKIRDELIQWSFIWTLAKCPNMKNNQKVNTIRNKEFRQLLFGRRLNVTEKSHKLFTLFAPFPVVSTRLLFGTDLTSEPWKLSTTSAPVDPNTSAPIETWGLEAIWVFTLRTVIAFSTSTSIFLDTLATMKALFVTDTPFTIGALEPIGTWTDSRWNTWASIHTDGVA